MWYNTATVFISIALIIVLHQRYNQVNQLGLIPPTATPPQPQPISLHIDPLPLSAPALIKLEATLLWSRGDCILKLFNTKLKTFLFSQYFDSN